MEITRVDHVAEFAGKLQKQSLHQRIRTDIEVRILSGAWSPGHRIPFEHELMSEYGCARMTVNKALYSLAEAGLIERRRRAGSFVKRPNHHSAVLAIPDIRAEILARGKAYRYELLFSRRRRATKADREILAVAGTARILVLRCRHFAGRRPFAFEYRRIVIDEVPNIAEVDLASEPPGSWLLRHIPWHTAEHQITAVGAGADVAALLAIPSGTACLVVDRRTWRMGATITAVRTWFPGDLQKLVTRFTPSGAAEGSADRG